MAAEPFGLIDRDPDGERVIAQRSPVAVRQIPRPIMNMAEIGAGAHTVLFRLRRQRNVGRSRAGRRAEGGRLRGSVVALASLEVVPYDSDQTSSRAFRTGRGPERSPSLVLH